MIASQSQVMAEVLEMLGQLARDWEYSGAITAETWLFEDLAFESLDIVVLGASLQEKYGMHMPFAEFLVEVGQREVRDISVGELVEFVQQQIENAATEGTA